MRPAGSFYQGFMLAVIQAVETRIGICLQDAAKVLQMLAGALTLTIRRIAKQHGGRIGATGGPVIAHVSPQPSILGLAGTGSQHWDRGVIGMQLVRTHDVVSQGPDQWVDQRTDRSDPVGERGAIELYALSGINLALAVQRNVVTIIRRTPDYAESRTANTCDGRSWCDPVDELRHSHRVRAGSETLGAGRWRGIDQAEHRWVQFWQGSSL